MLPIFLQRTKSELETPRLNVLQQLFFEDYFNHPENVGEGLGYIPREDPQASILAGRSTRKGHCTDACSQ